MSRAGDGFNPRSAQSRPPFRQLLDGAVNCGLIVHGQRGPPLLELVGIFDLPPHIPLSITHKTYVLQAVARAYALTYVLFSALPVRYWSCISRSDERDF